MSQRLHIILERQIKLNNIFVIFIIHLAGLKIRTTKTVNRRKANQSQLKLFDIFH